MTDVTSMSLANYTVLCLHLIIHVLVSVSSYFSEMHILCIKTKKLYELKMAASWQ